MDARTTIFYDVDTQRDFILPNGKLCVVGTERIIPTLEAVTGLARKHHIRIIGSVDRHFLEDPELQRNGGEFPDHCMNGTDGQRKIDATAPLNPRYVENRTVTSDEVQQILDHPGEVIFEKQLFDVGAGNRNSGDLLPRLCEGYSDIVVYGVYTEVCVRDAIEALRKLNKRLHVVVDATADIGADGPSFRAKWRAQGIDLLSFDELKRRLEG